MSIGQTAGWIKMALGVEVGLGPVRIVLDGDTTQLPSPKKGQGPHPSIFGPSFVVHGQTAGCIKMPLGTEVGLCPGDFVFDGDPAP